MGYQGWKSVYAKMLLKELLTRLALCNLIYVQEYKGLVYHLDFWLNFIKCAEIKRNYCDYLIKTLYLVMTDIKYLLKWSFLFKKIIYQHQHNI